MLHCLIWRISICCTTACIHIVSHSKTGCAGSSCSLQMCIIVVTQKLPLCVAVCLPRRPPDPCVSGSGRAWMRFRKSGGLMTALPRTPRTSWRRSAPLSSSSNCSKATPRPSQAIYHPRKQQQEQLGWATNLPKIGKPIWKSLPRPQRCWG